MIIGLCIGALIGIGIGMTLMAIIAVGGRGDER